MAANMTNLFEAIYTRYAMFRAEDDAYTLTEGRMARTQAPDLWGKAHVPYIVVTQIGGSIDEMFSGDALENVNLQFSVFHRFRNDAGPASLVMQSLIQFFNFRTLHIPGTEEYIRMRRDGMQRETIDIRTYIHISQDWFVEQQVPHDWR